MTYANNYTPSSPDDFDEERGAADPGMITHIPSDHPSRQSMPAPAELQRLTPDATPSYAAPAIERVQPPPARDIDYPALQRTPGVEDLRLPVTDPGPPPAPMQSGQDLARVPSSTAPGSASPAGRSSAGRSILPAASAAPSQGTVAPDQASISDRLGRDMIAYGLSRQPPLSVIGKDLQRVAPAAQATSDPNEAFSDLIGRRVQEYAEAQRAASPPQIQPRDSGRLQRAEMQASQARSDIASGTPEEVETARSVLGVPRILQGVVLPGAKQQALDQLRDQGPPAGEKGFLGRLKEMGKGALLGIETGRGAVPGAIVGAADPDELERERYYTQTLPRAEKLAASEAAQQQEELRRASEVAGQTGVYPITGEQTTAGAYKKYLQAMGQDKSQQGWASIGVQQTRADTARELGWARIDQGDRRSDQGDTGLLIRRAQTILSGYARGGTLTADDRAALKAAGVNEELPDKYDRTKVEVDPILGRVRFIKPEAGTVNEQTITPRQPSGQMSRQERQQAYQDIVNGLEQNPNWKNHPKRQEIMSRLKRQFQVK